VSGVFCFATGMAAIAAVMRLLRPGDEAIMGNDLYGGTYRLFSKILNCSEVNRSLFESSQHRPICCSLSVCESISSH
jgi:cystathionine beta-lyase/cystathionine gamma-synthase